MRQADRPGLPGLRIWGLVPAAVLVASGLAAGCSSKPAYCAAADQLKTSVQDLGNVNINVHDLSSVNTAVSKVQANAKTFASEAKSAYPSQTTALKTSLSGLQSAVTSAMGQPSLTSVAAVVSSAAQVKTAADNVQTAVKGKCQ
jgi:outer membrane murein-binding lipoprotein Lpp